MRGLYYDVRRISQILMRGSTAVIPGFSEVHEGLLQL